MISFSVSHDTDRLNVRDLTAEERSRLEEATSSGGILYWEYYGQTFKVPNAVLHDVLRALRDWETMKRRGRIADLPPVAGEIKLEQAVDSPTRSRK